MKRITRHPLRQALIVIVASVLPCTASNFEKEIRPLLKQYCFGCHSTEKHKGDLDLERFTSLSEVMKYPKVWQGFVEQLSLGEMPPKEKPQPAAAQRVQLLGWANGVLDDFARARSGDPGPVVLRRLSNAEYTYTIRDLTGVESLDPAKEFPADSASGEGFMNVGNSLVMSPSLVTKYLDAAKEIGSHAVLLPDGLRFSPKSTGRDWTEELLAEIRATYREFTDNGGGTSVNLQGIHFDTKDGGVLPVDKYLAVLLKERAEGKKPPVVPAGLSTKYLKTLRETLNSMQPNFLLDPIRARWRSAKPGDAASLAKEISQWQHALWKFNSIGHIGKRDGPKAWMEPLTPIQAKQELRFKFPVSPEAKEVTLYLSASDAGDGNKDDCVIWEQPRLAGPGQTTLLLRDVREVSRELSARRERTLAATAKYLAAAAQAEAGKTNVAELARHGGVDAGALAAWLAYLGVGSSGPVKVEGYFTDTFTNVSGYSFISGWGKSDPPNLAANSSDQHVRIPGNMKPHSVAVHPSPTLAAAVGWRSPMAGKVRVEAAIQHAHPECGNGVSWSLELRRGSNRQRLANGIAQGAKEVRPEPIENVVVQPGDLVSLLIGPRDANHSCDLTAVDLILESIGEGGREWNLAKDVSPNVLAGNPHADRFGNDGVWHFYTEPDKGGPFGPVIPAGSLLAKWQASGSAEEKQKLAEEVQILLTSAAPEIKDSPDAALYRQLTSLGGPLFASVAEGIVPAVEPGVPPGGKAAEGSKSVSKSGTSPGRMPPSTAGETPAATWGPDPAQFGKHPNGSAIDAASLCVRAPAVIEIRLPSDLVAGCEFVTTGALDNTTGAEGSVQFQLLTNKPPGSSGLLTMEATTKEGDGPWNSNNRTTSHNTPIIVNDSSAARKRIEAAFDEFRQVFPAALCYTKIVPVDEVVTLTLYYREDHYFRRLMLDDTRAARLDRLWDELHYVAQDDLKLVDVFEQIWQYATQDADPSVFEPMREPIKQRAAAFRRRLVDTQPAHLDAVLKFANGAYRRPLTASEKDELRGLYHKLRAEEMPHEEAIRLTLARVLVAPAFLYRAEKPGPGNQPGPVNDWELATRLSYFLWSSAPDAELRGLAASGKLRKTDALAAQTRRMLRDPRVRRLATEFACAWLHIYDFDELGEKSDRHFPTFAGLRGAMYEETIRFFTDLFRRDGSVLDILDADYTFLNEGLAKHYGIQESLFRSSRREEAPTESRESKIDTRSSSQSLVTSAATGGGADWRRVDGVRRFARGGILAQATTLAKQSGASRTSPILRGDWVAEVLLGEKIPRPPKDVPRLPEDEATETLTVRELTEKHSTDPKCYGCHRRMDPYGFSLEAFDAIGRFRDRDLGGRPIETRAKTMDGAEFDGLDGLRDYLLTKRRDAFLKQFCRKLLGYSLGRGLLLSDGPLISEMRDKLKSHEYRVGAAIETIVRSKQFREIRGKEMASEE